jgi:hypothetical protein
VARQTLRLLIQKPLPTIRVISVLANLPCMQKKILISFLHWPRGWSIAINIRLRGGVFSKIYSRTFLQNLSNAQKVNKIEGKKNPNNIHHGITP